MTRLFRFGPKAWAVLVAATALAADGQAPPSPRPLPDSGLVENVTTRLQQIDVTLTGKPEDLEGIGKKDFDVTVGGQTIEEFVVDRVCQEPLEHEQTDLRTVTPAATELSTPTNRRRPATFVFYFDQPHLTMMGRATAIGLAEEFTPKLIATGAQIMILSNASRLTTYLPLTRDPHAVMAALGRMKRDMREFDSYAVTEDERVAEAVAALQGDPRRAQVLIRDLQREEVWRQTQALDRLEIALYRLAELDPPKAVLYFADTLRANPGAYYSSFGGSESLQDEVDTVAGSAQFNMDHVLGEAGATGVRLYTVEAAGLQANGLFISNRHVLTSGGPGANRRRFTDAQDTLASMALETGGKAFLNGIPAGKMVQKILDDLSCIYLISFDPRSLPKDRALPVTIKVDRPNVTVQVRGRLVVQSETKRRESRLLASFAAPEATRNDVTLHVGLIPTGFADGKFSARVQVVIAPTPLSGASWDVGASLISRGSVSQHASERISVTDGNVPIVFETEMDLRPGPFELVAVAHESVSDQIASKQISGEFPKPDEATASLGPIAVAQPVSALFVRGDRKRTTGDLALAENQIVRRDRPTAIVGIVCRAKNEKQTLTVSRTLFGEDDTVLPSTEIPYDVSQPCAQFRDLIPANTLGEGRFRYVVRVSDGAGEIAAAKRSFVVVGGP